MIDNINMVIKNIIVNLFSILIFFKLCTWIKPNKISKAVLIFFSIGLSLLYVYIKIETDIIIAIFSVYLLEVVIIKILTKQRTSTVLIGIIISAAFSYILLTTAASIEFGIQKVLDINNKIINTSITLLIEGILTFYIFKIKRLKNGFTFLKMTNEYIEFAIINISIVIIVMYGLLGSNHARVTKHIFFYFIMLACCMIITIQKILVMYYKQKLIDDTINQYQKELKEKDEKIEKLTKENYRASKINHEFYNRQKSLEYMVKNSLTNYNTELGEDVDILSKIKNLTEEHSNKVSEDKILLKLETTGIDEVDEMFTYMQQECIKNNIEFKLKINGNIYPLINNYITKSQLVTLIGDHLRDAIIAINFSNKSNKKIFVILGIKENCYELCIYDSGIEFEIQTLLKLGMEPITTHKNSGGTGIGFMTTFETLKECKASLIIEEYGDNIEYTKLVKFKFDKKSEYKICSYRSDEIKKLDYSNRIKIENKLTNI